MNAPTDLALVADTPTAEIALDSFSLMMNGDAFERLRTFADIMANGVISVPEHFRKKPADCFAVCLQATTWGMNPYAVAQKTHITQGGALGYEAQLIYSVVVNRAPIKARPDFEFIGNWSKILGKVKEMKSERGGKYYVSDWKPSDEEGLGVIIRCTLRGESQPREVVVMMSQAWPRFSTQWATDPQQQICYLATRKWARRYTPDVILGVHTKDELDAGEPVPRDMGRADVVPPAVAPEIPAGLIRAAEQAAAKGVAAYQKFWQDTGPANRKLLAARHDGWKADAAAADAARTVDTPPPAAASAAPAGTPPADADGVVDDDFVAQMDAAERAAKGGAA